MTCGGRTYVVNEDDGFCNGKKVTRHRDTSYRSFISFLLLILLFWVLIACAIWAIQSSKNDKSKDDFNSSSTKQDGWHGSRPTSSKTTKEFHEHTTNHIPVTEIFYKEKAYTTGEKEKSYSNNTQTTIPTISVTKTIKKDENTPKEVITTLQPTITDKPPIKEYTDPFGVKDVSSNSSTVKVDINTQTDSYETSTTQRSSMGGIPSSTAKVEKNTQTDFFIVPISTTPTNVVKDVSSKSSTIQVELITTDSSEILAATTSRSAMKNVSSNSSADKVDINIKTESYQESTVDLTTLRTDLIETNASNSSTERSDVSSNLSTDKIDINTKTESFQESAVIPTTARNDLVDDNASNSSTNKVSINTKTESSQESVVTTIRNDLVDETSSNSSATNVDINTETESSQESAIKLTTARNDLVLENASNSSTDRNDIQTESSLNGLVEPPTTVGLIEEGGSVNSSGSQNNLTATTQIVTTTNIPPIHTSQYYNILKKTTDTQTEYSTDLPVPTQSPLLPQTTMHRKKLYPEHLTTTPNSLSATDNDVLTTIKQVETTGQQPFSKSNKSEEESTTLSAFQLKTTTGLQEKTTIIISSVNENSSNSNTISFIASTSSTDKEETTTSQSVVQQSTQKSSSELFNPVIRHLSLLTTTEATETGTNKDTYIEKEEATTITLLNNIDNTTANVVETFQQNFTDVITTQIIQTTTKTDLVQQPTLNGLLGINSSTTQWVVPITIPTTYSTITNTIAAEPNMREPQITKKTEHCDTVGCLNSAKDMLSLIDFSKDPCDNFYEFSCGGTPNRPKNELVEVLLKAWYKKKILRRDMRVFTKFVSTCISYEKDTDIMEKIRNIETSNWNASNLMDLIIPLLLRQVTPLFNIKFGPINNKEKYGIQILPPFGDEETVGLRGQSLKKHIENTCFHEYPNLNFQDTVHLKEVYRSYTDCQKNTFKKIAEKYFTSINTPFEEQKDFIDFFNTIMFGVSNFDIEQAIINKDYKKTTIQWLNTEYGNLFDWKKLFKTCSFNDNTPVFIYMEKRYFRQLFTKLEIMLIQNKTRVLNNIETYYKLQLRENAIQTTTDKERYCMEQAIQLMPNLANAIFIDHTHLTTSHIDVFQSVFEKVRKQFDIIIDSSELETDQKKLIENKLAELQLKHFIDEVNEDRYSEAIGNTDLVSDHQVNVLSLTEARSRFANALKNPVNVFHLQHLFNDPFSKLPKYLPFTKTIVIPSVFIHDIAQMQMNKKPGYSIETYLRYHLARAVALYIDEIKDDLTTKIFKNFVNMLNVGHRDEVSFIFHNQEVILKDSNNKTDKILEMSNKNRIADNLALRVAYSVVFNESVSGTKLLPWISDDYSLGQQFFILVAQEYCKKTDINEMAQKYYETSDMSPIIRVEILMIHSDDFQREFDCSPGEHMNPDMKKAQFDAPQYDYSYSDDQSK